MNTLSSPPFFVRYMTLWASFCLVAVAILAWDRKRLVPEWREYLRGKQRGTRRSRSALSRQEKMVSRVYVVDVAIFERNLSQGRMPANTSAWASDTVASDRTRKSGLVRERSRNAK
jgi:hypothetical protein